jgi:hypothetical protein
MKVWAAAVLTAMAATEGARAATLAVTITGMAESAYELDVAGIQKTGRLGGPGAATVRDLIQVEGRQWVTARLTFTAPGGAVASCSAVKVTLVGAQASCEPAFVLTDRQAGAAHFACESRCEPRKPAQRSQEDDEDEEWIYALRRAPSAPRLDGWTQGVYSGAMPAAAATTVY